MRDLYDEVVFLKRNGEFEISDSGIPPIDLGKERDRIECAVEPFLSFIDSSKGSYPALVFPSTDVFASLIERIYGFSSDAPRIPSAMHYNTNKDWALGASARQAFLLAETGWASLAKECTNASVDVTNSLLDDKGRFNHFHDLTGAHVDVSAYLRGEPENMVEFDTFEPTERVIIYVNAFMAWSYSGSRLINRGIALMGVVQAFEALGINVQIEYFMNFLRTEFVYKEKQKHGDYCDNAFICIRLHESGAHLNIGKIIAWLGHPSITRSMFYASTFDMFPRPCGNGMCPSGYAPGSDIPGVKGIIQVPAGDSYVWETRDKALEWAKSTFAETMNKKSTR